MDIRDQVVLVTGASRGLGAATAKVFGREGAKVVVNYVNNEVKANEVVSSIGKDRSIAIRADVRNEKEVKRMFEHARAHFGQPITTIVNNALIDFTFNGDQKKNLDTIEWSDFQTQFEGSILGALNTLKAGRHDMAEAHFGKIINIGTNLFQNPVVAYHDYNTSKAALLGLTRNMAKELGADGITVNMVSGGLLEKTDASAATPDAVFSIIKESTPLQKVTSPEDVAYSILFFASPWSRAVTGQNLVVDGGLVMD
ncbi:3-oxoacyl-ACP reductase [Domibacillus epiphyticus]|uniref:3-oxoacyl-ACP reductase n=1 Tax=Domibacillus epiphyticus TaxID=1714355 RepID=A0A1V2A7E7_9BACI|nr:3-oxoacyl-ACP reductase [Domibacillus epiphyticus]OMP66867.1 3-oxoacyl-ACP reductase [Domibacillus epiphyticus]